MTHPLHTRIYRRVCYKCCQVATVTDATEIVNTTGNEDNNTQNELTASKILYEAIRKTTHKAETT